LTAAGETSWHGYARYVVDAALQRGLPLRTSLERIVPVPSSAFPSPARRPHNSRLSTHKLRRALGIDLPELAGRCTRHARQPCFRSPTP
jgi:dTDP-4-dehydrorhamnose reductase